MLELIAEISQFRIVFLCIKPSDKIAEVVIVLGTLQVSQPRPTSKSIRFNHTHSAFKYNHFYLLLWTMPSTERELHKDSFDSLLCLIDYQALKSWLSLNRHKEKQKLISDLSFTIPLGLNPENSSRILIASLNSICPMTKYCINALPFLSLSLSPRLISGYSAKIINFSNL